MKFRALLAVEKGEAISAGSVEMDERDLMPGDVVIDVDYSTAPGDFDGTGAEVDCTPRVAGISSFNDVDGTSTLRAGLIVPAGFLAPRLFMECKFSASGGTPTADDFVVTIVDITDVSLNPVTDSPEIAVTLPD